MLGTTDMLRNMLKAQKKARLQWASDYQQVRDDDWAQIIWSDECYIYLDNKNSHVYVTQCTDEVLLDECIVPTFKQSNIHVMIWACIMKDRRGPLIVLEYKGGKGGGMNSSRYQEQVLDGVLVDFYKAMRLEGGNIMFQQDRAPAHHSKSTLKWFRFHNSPLFPHPSLSPDLNPIKPCWHELKTHLWTWPRFPGTLQAVKQIWKDLLIKDINKHIRTMNERVQAVLDAKGSHTQF